VCCATFELRCLRPSSTPTVDTTIVVYVGLVQPVSAGAI
jgi:hypothetical protein